MSDTEQKPGRVEVTSEMRQTVGEIVEYAQADFCNYAQQAVSKGEISEVEILATLQHQGLSDFEDVWADWMKENED